MHKKIKRIYTLVITAALIVSLAGCALINNKKPEPTGYEPVIEISTPEPVIKTTVVYARSLDETDAALKIIDEFNLQSETVNVKYQELPSDDTERYNQIRRWLASGDSSIDIFDIDMTWSAEFAQHGYTTSLNDYIEKENINMKNYNTAIVNGCTFNGQQWAMPRLISTGLFFYRHDIVDTPPQDWDDFIVSAAEHAGKSNTKYGYVFSGKISESLVNEAMELIYSYGGDVIDSNGEIVINSLESAAGLNKLYEIYNGSFVPDTEYKMTEIDACISFLNGESVYMRNLPSAWAILNKRANSQVVGKFSIAPLPKGSAGSFSVLNGYVSVISKESKKQDEAWEFIKFVSGYEGQKLLSIQSGRIPAMTKVLDDPDVIEVNPHFASDIFRNTLQTAVPNIVTPYYRIINGVIQDELYLFLTGKKTAESALFSMESKLHMLLKS